mmetsp:Transcript_1151/g.4120  ORF Transcript_1151/g.4120 Transcript_1151/m.4120 type:complete len:107 (-) Transcript_1151:13-333(-)
MAHFARAGARLGPALGRRAACGTARVAMPTAAPVGRGAAPAVRVAMAGETAAEAGGSRRASMLRGMSGRRSLASQALNAAKRPAAAGLVAHLDLLSLLFGNDDDGG